MADIGQIISARWLAAVCFVALLAGCSGGDRQKWLGTWEGSYNLGLSDPTSPVARTASRVELRITSENRFLLIEAGAPKEGRVRFDGEKAYLTVETFMNRPIEDQGSSAVAMNDEIVLTMQGENTILFRDPRSLIRTPNGQPASIELKRTQPAGKG